MKLTEAMVMLTVTCAQLASNAGVVVWSPDVDNSPQREGNAEPKGSDKWSEHREGGPWLRDVHMRGGGLAPPLFTRCVGCWWCKSGGAVHSPNASGGDAGQGLVVRRARQVVAAAANDAQGKRRLYENLAQLTVDAINTLSIKYLSIYSGEAAGLLLMRWLSQRSSIMWDVTPCSTSSSHPHSSADQVLILVLCDYDATVDVLSRALAWDQLRAHTWFFLNLDQPLATRDPQLYIPIDSMVVEVRNPAEDLFVLQEVWSPGQRIKLKHALIAIWRAHAQDAGSLDEADGEAVATVGNEWPERDLTISTGRLTMSSKPKYERRKDLTGVHFVVTSINDTRAHNSHYDYVHGRDVLSGYFGDVWELLKSEMNFTYTVMTPADGEFGSNSKGYWTGLVADVLSGRAHVVVAYLSQTYSRAQVVDYSSVLIKFSYRIFARPPERSAVSWTSYTRPFFPGLWVGLALALLALATAFYCVSCFYRRQVSLSGGGGAGGVRSDEGFQQWQVDSPLIMWAAITQQGWPDTPEAGALRVLFWTMYVVGVVVVAAYSATLVSFLTVAGDQLPFDSLADLKMLPKYRLGILKGSRLEEYFKNKNFLEYWEALIEPYSDTLMKSYEELRSHALEDSGYAYVGTYEIQRLDPVGACTFRSARQHLLFNDGALGWPRGSPYVQVFDHFISKFRESGLLKKLMDVWYPRPYSCPQQPVVPLGFKQVFTAFVMLGLSAALSILLLCLEKIFSWCRYEQLRAQNAATTSRSNGTESQVMSI